VGIKMIGNLLRNLFVDDLFVTVYQESGRYFVRLKEQGKDAKLEQVDIYGVGNDAILLNIDKYKKQQVIFKGELGENKRCDYILLTEMNGQKIMLFIELKSKTVKHSEVIKKFKATECLIDYCNEILNKFLNDNSLKEYIRLFVVFYKHNIPKRKTRPIPPRPISSFKNPEKFLRYPSPFSSIKINLNKLVKL
jgi:hypothetical protein